MKHIPAILVFLLLASAAPAHPEEIIIWRDAAGDAHAAKSIEEIPEAFRPSPVSAESGTVLTTLTPAQVDAALAEGKALASRPSEYKNGLGLYHRYTYTLNGKDAEAYLFVGTKYGLLKARAALTSEKGGKVPKAYIDKVLAQDRVYVAFYGRGFEPALLLLKQDDTVIKGEDGFGDVDPGLASARMVKSFPYAAVYFTRPATVEVYNLDGNSIEFELDWGGYK